ncbi:MAG: hypothetical protein HZB38_15500 [Planctomycetes bacterium]|nr:hypothetical protein [Planctomycetota bacterium]
MPVNESRPNADELLRQLEDDLSEGRISAEQMRERLKADAERPIDPHMLRSFCDAYEQRVTAFSAMLQTIVDIATDQRDPDAWRRRETEVDEHVQRMMGELPLWKEQVCTVFEFLTELRASSGHGPVRLGDLSHSTAHLLAAHVMDVAAQAWRGCKEIAYRSRTDPRYLYAAGASGLFFNAHIQGLPKPNDLMGLLHLERAAAMKALRDGTRPQRVDATHATNSISVQAQTVTVTGQSVSVAADQIEMNASVRKPAKERMKREVAEPLIAQHLMQRPHDTAAQVAEKVGCSVGVVAESEAWKRNQTRLDGARKLGVDPKAVDLGYRQGGEWKDGTELIPDERSADPADMAAEREEELFRRIGEYEKDHPDATPEQVARALRDFGCTAGDVERRQAVLNRLIAQQSDDHQEDVDVEDPDTKSGKRRKWVPKRP